VWLHKMDFLLWDSLENVQFSHDSREAHTGLMISRLSVDALSTQATAHCCELSCNIVFHVERKQSTKRSR
jgi:hypothetical protein